MCQFLIQTLSGGVLVVLDEPSQAEVGDLTHQVISHQDVGGSQVSVDVVHPLDEGHAVCDLRRERTMQRNGGGGGDRKYMFYQDATKGRDLNQFK